MKPLAIATAILACACAVTIALAQQAPEPAPEPKPQPAPKELTQAEKDALATHAYFVLRNRCWGCHGEPGKTAYGETVPLDWILDYDKLVEAKLVIPGKVKESRLIYLTTLGKMPREFDENGKPSKEGELPEAEQKALIEWVKAGAPKWPEMKFTHEWVPLAPPPWEEARVFESHQGVLCIGVDSGETKAAVCRQGKWVVLAEQPTGMTALPEDACVSIDGKRTDFVVNEGQGARAYQWDGEKFARSAPEFWLPLRTPSLVSGPGATDLQVLTNLTPARVGGKVEYGYGAFHLLMTSNQWMQLLPGWTFGVLDAACDKDGVVVVLSIGSGNTRVLYRKSEQAWQVFGEFQIPEGAHGAATLGANANEVLCWSTGLAVHRSGKVWEQRHASQPHGKIASAAWDASADRWIVLTGSTQPNAMRETWALIPWRKAK